jgi:hypothetical protein
LSGEKGVHGLFEQRGGGVPVSAKVTEAVQRGEHGGPVAPFQICVRFNQGFVHGVSSLLLVEWP